jgi:hypothetical protein
MRKPTSSKVLKGSKGQVRQRREEVVMMNAPEISRDSGLERIIREGKKRFRIPENTQHYSEEQYKQAEKKFIKLCIIGGKC